jgi:hypothetical protein
MTEVRQQCDMSRPGDGVLEPTVTPAVLMLFTEATTPIREALWRGLVRMETSESSSLRPQNRVGGNSLQLIFALVV